MNAVVPLPAAGKSASRQKSSNASDDLKKRHSPELVIALSGPVGSGMDLVINSLTGVLTQRNYEVVRVKVTSKFSEVAEQLGIVVPKAQVGDECERISNMMNLGNQLRERLGEDLGAQLAVRAIAIDRSNKHPDDDYSAIEPKRVAYIIDQLKHPREAALLRSVYGSMFYLIGVLCGYERRKRNLSMPADKAEQLMERDKAESDNKNGQQLEKTLKLADFFVRNAHQNTSMLDKAMERFAGLVHGEAGLTPNRHERGMYAAYTAGLRSACLSRQVGASIMSPHGEIISSGCNDVPKAGGGLYEPHPEHDHRCVFLEGGLCFNDRTKDELRDDIRRVLINQNIPPADAQRFADAIRNESRLKDLIEFSRSVHAEMDSIVKLARAGGQGIQGSILFTTTYPCHNCARHIVASGIRAVYFIEPYGKSLAEKLHSDAIDHEPEEDPDWTNPLFSRVAFLHFEGVAPHRFASLFSVAADRKDGKGTAIKTTPASSLQREPESLDNYREIEGRIIERLVEKGAIPIP